jgi:hypothetical protein
MSDDEWSPEVVWLGVRDVPEDDDDRPMDDSTLPRAPIPSELEQREDEARQQPDEEWERLLRVLDGPPKPKP